MMATSDNEMARSDLPESILEMAQSDMDLKCKYATGSQCYESLKGTDHKYCSLHINIHSLPAKLEQLKLIISEIHKIKIRVHFILLCETFLNNNSQALCNIDSYNLVCKNRDSKGGGVAIYVHDSLNFKERPDLSVNVQKEFESIFIEVKQTPRPIIVGEIYRVPNTNEAISIDRFITVIWSVNQVGCYHWN